MKISLKSQRKTLMLTRLANIDHNALCLNYLSFAKTNVNIYIFF